MARNLGKSVDFDFFNEDSNYDSVVYLPGKPVLGSEINLLQAVAGDQARKASGALATSGWASFRDAKVLSGQNEGESFYTQDPAGAIPEVALVNGWALKVDGTNTTYTNTNKISLAGEGSRISKGARADGVFLEVWRGLIADEMDGLTAPAKSSSVPDMRGMWVLSYKDAFLVGDDGAVLRYRGSSVWDVVTVPSAADLKAVAFNEGGTVGFIVGARGEILRSTDSGSTWLRVVSGVQEDLNAVAVMSEGDKVKVLVVGNGGTILYSDDGGITYQVGGAGDFGAVDLYAAHFLPGSKGSVSYIAGASGVIALRSQSQGLWYKCSVPSSFSESVFRSIAFLNEREGIVVGDSGASVRTLTGSSFDALGSDLSANQFTTLVVADPGRLKLTMALDGTTGPVGYVPANQLYQSFSTEMISETVAGSYHQYLHITMYRKMNQSLSGTSLSEYQDVDFVVNGVSRSVDQVLDDIRSLVTFQGRPLFQAELSSIGEAAVAGGSASTSQVGMTIGAKVYAFGWTGSAETQSPVAMKLSDLGDGWDVVPGWADSLSSAGVSSIFCAGSYSDSYLFVSGRSASVASIDMTVSDGSSSTWVRHSHDIYRRVVRRVYNGGNKLTPPPNNINRDDVNPNIGVPVSNRTQIQYRIRVVTGIDQLSYPDSGLGSPAATALGPNQAGVAGGIYESMASVSGDAGLYRAVCRNTVDGFSYAIPMFIVHRKNQSAYNPVNNINGSSKEGVAMRPDGQFFEAVGLEEITDVRRRISAANVSGAVADLVEGLLATQVSFSSKGGTQMGSTYLAVDTFSGSAYPKAASPATAGAETTSGLTLSSVSNTTTPLSVLKNGYYSTRTSEYQDQVVANSKSYPLGGRFDGLGTSAVVYRGPGSNLKLTVMPSASAYSSQYEVKVANLTGMSLIKAGAYFTWTQASVTPFQVVLVQDLVLQDGVGVANVARINATTIGPASSFVEGAVELVSSLPAVGVTTTGTEAVNISAIKYLKNSDNLLTGVPVKPLSVRVYEESNPDESSEFYFGAQTGVNGRTLAEGASSLGSSYRDSVDLVVNSSVNATELPFRIEATVHLRVSSSDFYLDVPKDVFGYTTLGVKSVTSLDGLLVHRVSEVVAVNGSTYMRVSFAKGYAPALGSTVVVTLESFSVSQGMIQDYPALFSGITADNGQTEAAFKSPFVAIYSSGRSGIRSMYRSEVVKVDFSSGAADVTIANTFGTTSLLSAELATMTTDAGTLQYVLVALDTGSGVMQYKTVLVSTVSQTGAQMHIQLRDIADGQPFSGTGFVLLTQFATLTNSVKMQIAYRTPAPQTLSTLGDSVELEVLDGPVQVLVSSGGGYVPYPVDLAPYFSSCIPEDPSSGGYGEFYYQDGGVSIPGVGTGYFLEAPVTMSNLGRRLTLTGRTIDGRGDAYYVGAEGRIILSTLPCEVPSSRKLACAFPVKVLSGARAGEQLLAVVFRTLTGTTDNLLVVRSPSESSEAGVALFRIKGAPYQR